jgi:hypothetical protein
MEDPDTAVDELQQLHDVRERFYDFLWNYEVALAQADESPGSSQAETSFPYRCAAARIPAIPQCDEAGHRPPARAPR